MHFDPVTDHARRFHEQKRAEKQKKEEKRRRKEEQKKKEEEQKIAEAHKKASEERKIIVCPACGGRGITRDPRRLGAMHCPRCGGKGWIYKESSFCFIATAAYGTPLAPEVDWLRRWRDDFLLKSRMGRYFIRAYYRFSPPIAKIIGSSTPLKIFTKCFLIPLIEVVKFKYKRIKKGV